MSTQTGNKYQVEIQINLDGIPGRVQVRLQWLINMVAFGLQAADRFEPDRLALPETQLTMQLSSDKDAFDVAQVRRAFSIWVLANGLRAIMEEFSSSLEEARLVLAAWTLKSGDAAGAQWNQLMVGERLRFHRLGFPDKLVFLRTRYGVALPIDTEKDLISLNQARNCLVHREGIVSFQDLPVSQAQFSEALGRRRRNWPQEAWSNDQTIAALKESGLQPSLEATWLCIEVFGEKDGVERILDLRQQPVVEGGTNVGLRVTRKRAQFEIGTLVQFSADDFSQIAYTLFNAAKALRGAVESRGRAVGATFLSSPNDQSAEATESGTPKSRPAD